MIKQLIVSSLLIAVTFLQGCKTEPGTDGYKRSFLKVPIWKSKIKAATPGKAETKIIVNVQDKAEHT